MTGPRRFAGALNADATESSDKKDGKGGVGLHHAVAGARADPKLILLLVSSLNASLPSRARSAVCLQLVSLFDLDQVQNQFSSGSAQISFRLRSEHVQFRPGSDSAHRILTSDPVRAQLR